MKNNNVWIKHGFSYRQLDDDEQEDMTLAWELLSGQPTITPD